MLLVYILVRFVLFFETILPIQADGCPVSPEIIIQESYPNVTSQRNRSAVYFSERVFVVLKCSSQKPIFWDFAHDHSPTRRTINPFDIQTFCFEATLFLYTGINATGEYSCQEFGDPSKESSIYLFIEDEKTGPLTNWQPNIRIVNPVITNNGWLQIPCKTSNPNTRILLKKDGNILELSENVRWNNQKGYFLNTRFYRDYSGSYTCQSPQKNSTNREFKIIIENKESNLEPPQIYLNATTREASCEVPKTSEFTDFLWKKCNNLMECFNTEKRSFYRDADDGRAIDCTGDDEENQCKAYRFENIPNQGIVKTGVLQCTARRNKNSVSVSKFLYQFYGISGQAYALSREDLLNIQHSKQADLVLVTMKPESSMFYVGQEVTFECKVIAFVISGGIEWAFRLKNGTLLSKTSVNYTESSSIDTWQQGFKITSFMKIKLPSTEINSVICLAPFWNNYEWLRSSSSQFEVLATTEPSVLLESKKGEINHHVYTNERNVSFGCSAEGVPKPTIEWTKIGADTLPPGAMKVDVPEVSKLRMDSEEETVARSLLVFSTVTKDLEGEYTCTASNYGGSTMKNIKVDVLENQKTLIGIVLGSLSAILLLVIFILFLYRRLVVQRRLIKQILSENEVDEFFNGNPEQRKKGAELPQYAQFLPYKKEYEIIPTKLQVDDQNVLGSGQFGMVYKAKLQDVDGSDEREVAVKTVKPGAEKDYLKALLSEIKIMMAIGSHTNVVEFIGALTENIRDGKLMIVVEFCGRGSLEKYLRDNRKYFVNQIQDDIIDSKITSNTNNDESAACTNNSSDTDGQKDDDRIVFDTCKLVKWACEIAAGMEYLAGKKVIHADLACRNILLNKDGFLKITDFGLSRQLYENMDYVKKSQDPLPWRWMAIESIRDMSFSVHSDTWSYGVTVWEIFSLGAMPYPGYVWDGSFMKKLEEGLRPEKPSYATNAIYENMMKCWNIEPEDRPSFSDIKKFYSHILTELSDKTPNSNYVSIHIQ